nr:unnamed protein product [Digitaria exilis]
MKDPPPELCFGRTIYVDCSSWTSKRAMQKVIAQQLRLNYKTMTMFDEQDEEDDFNGVDLGSREAIRSVAIVIDRHLRESRFMMIFINGGDEEVVLGTLGIPQSSDNVIILWTFSARLVTMHTRGDLHEIERKLRYTDVFLWTGYLDSLPNSEFIALLHQEAANIIALYPCMWGMDLARVVDCCLYGLLLMYHTSRSSTGFAWSAHASNFWICDGIIQGDRAWEISNALDTEISFEGYNVHDVLRRLNRDRKTLFFLVDSRLIDVYKERPCRWISITTLRNNTTQEEVQTALAVASSIFLAFNNKHDPVGLPNGYFKQYTNLAVLVLSCCAFNFLSPPFLHCYTLRFLGLDHCKHNNRVIELEGGGGCATTWAFLKSVQVIDLYYTEWVEILSEEKIKLMANLMELNIEGVRWPRCTINHRIQKKLFNLQRLRMIMSTYNVIAETETTNISNSFLLMDNTCLEILDLSGSNINIIIGRNLAESISKARRLQVLILDGCDGLGDVMLPNNSSLRSFSFDGYGISEQSHRGSTVELPPKMSRPEQASADADKKKGVVKTSIVSLQGCGCLDNLFLRGLPNLVELDLSGCAIKVLDFGSMVVDVPMLKRLFLIGCERLRAIKWGDKMAGELQMICIDTRPRSGMSLGCAPPHPPSLDALQKPFELQVHAISMDARLARSLYAHIDCASSRGSYYYFNIRITSSSALISNNSTEAALQPAKKASEEMMMVGSSSGQRRENYHVEGGMLLYGDVFTKVSDGPTLMQDFPQAPTEQSNGHIEIGGGSHSVQSEVELPYADNLSSLPYVNNLALLMCSYTKSLHVHDVSTCSSTMPAEYWQLLRLCRVERCPSLQVVFPPGAEDINSRLETIWVSDLLMARCVWSKSKFGFDANHLRSLRHLHLRCCPSLWFALPTMSNRPSFPSLETLHIIHCGNLKHIFVPNDEKNKHTSSVHFPKLTTIHLHDLPALQQICKGAETLALALETIRIRGCPNLRRLPALRGREDNMNKPDVEVEKDVGGGEGCMGHWSGTGWTPATTLPSTRRPCTRASTRGTCSEALY